MRVKKLRKHAGSYALLAGILFLLFFALAKGGGQEKRSFGEVLKESAADACADRILKIFLPVFAFAQEQGGVGQLAADTQFCQVMPLYSFVSRNRTQSARVEDRMTIDMILLAEGSDEGSWSAGQDGAWPGGPSQGHLEDGFPEAGDTSDNGPAGSETGALTEDGADGLTLEELLRAENEAAGGEYGTDASGTDSPGAGMGEQIASAPEFNAGSGIFVPHQKQVQVDLESLKDYEALVKTFYTVDSSTMIGSDQLNIADLGSKDMTVSKDTGGPQILIYHTHSQEAFADSTPGDVSTGIVGVGEYLTKVLTEQYGYQVLHHTGQYDVKTRDDAYSRSLPAIEQVLAENPGIQVVIDLHRDAMAEETHLVMDLDGRPTARFMFFNGLSRTKKTGNISYLYNENLNDNLAFSYQMQMKAAEYYPGLTRKIYLKGYRYNMHLRPKTLLIELGAQNNTLEEAMNACDPLAHILDMVLSGTG